jgi:hypothetical protein
MEWFPHCNFFDGSGVSNVILLAKTTTSMVEMVTAVLMLMAIKGDEKSMLI